MVGFRSPLSICPTLSLPHCVHKCVLCVCVGQAFEDGHYGILATEGTRSLPVRSWTVDLPVGGGQIQGLPVRAGGWGRLQLPQASGIAVAALY